MDGNSYLQILELVKYFLQTSFVYRVFKVYLQIPDLVQTTENEHTCT